LGLKGNAMNYPITARSREGTEFIVHRGVLHANGVYYEIGFMDQRIGVRVTSMGAATTGGDLPQDVLEKIAEVTDKAFEECDDKDFDNT